LHFADSVGYSEDMKKNKIGLWALKREANSMKLYRVCFIAFLLNGSSAHAWEIQRQSHNAHYLNPLLKSSDPGIKTAAKSLLDCDPRVVKSLTPLLNQPRGDMQTAGIDLAHIASTRSIDPSTTHAVLAIATLLQEDPSYVEKAQSLLEELKNTEQSEENCAIGREASALHRRGTPSK
jgi:hypothetical protein